MSSPTTLGHREDITLADKICPTRKDASPSCTNKDESVHTTNHKNYLTEVQQVSTECPARNNASPSCINLEESLKCRVKVSPITCHLEPTQLA